MYDSEAYCCSSVHRLVVVGTPRNVRRPLHLLPEPHTRQAPRNAARGAVVVDHDLVVGEAAVCRRDGAAIFIDDRRVRQYLVGVGEQILVIDSVGRVVGFECFGVLGRAVEPVAAVVGISLGRQGEEGRKTPPGIYLS